MSETTEELFPVTLVYHGNRYSSRLFDVDGNPLVGDTGMYLNVFTEEFKDMLVSKRIRFIHHLRHEPTYAYFVVSDEQERRFQQERSEGSYTPKTAYHVYPDF